jgi:hypothetical protein
MKKIVAGIIIALIGCVSIPSWVDAQQRDGGRGRSRGRGIAEQDYRGQRGQRRSYRGRQQRRRYYGGQWEWYDDALARGAGAAVGSFFGNLFRRDREEEEPEPAAETDEASLEPWSPGWFAYCKRKYKSFDIKDGRYLSYDGNRYFCKPD